MLHNGIASATVWFRPQRGASFSVLRFFEVFAPIGRIRRPLRLPLLYGSNPAGVSNCYLIKWHGLDRFRFSVLRVFYSISDLFAIPANDQFTKKPDQVERFENQLILFFENLTLFIT